MKDHESKLEQDDVKENLEPDQDDIKEKEQSVPVMNKFNINWHSGTKLSKVGRPRESKVKFKKKIIKSNS